MQTLKIEKLSKSFDQKSISAIDSISFELTEGRWASIMGPSGTGKSTLLKVIAGILPSDGGKVFAVTEDGKKVEEDPRVSYLSQGLEFDQSKNVFEHIKASAYGDDETEKYYLTREMIDLFSLHYTDDMNPEDLSYGQKQRLSFAIALASSPDWLLLDEPFAHLDELLAQELKQELKVILKRKNIGVLLVTHDLKDVLEDSDIENLFFLHYGKIYQQGPPQELFLRPVDSFVARFFGLSNLVMSKIEKKIDQKRYQVTNPFGRFTLGASIELGTRFEHAFMFCRANDILLSKKGHRFEAKVERLSFTQNGSLLELRTFGQKIYALDSLRLFQRGETLTFDFHYSEEREQNNLFLISS